MTYLLNNIAQFVICWWYETLKLYLDWIHTLTFQSVITIYLIHIPIFLLKLLGPSTHVSNLSLGEAPKIRLDMPYIVTGCCFKQSTRQFLTIYSWIKPYFAFVRPVHFFFFIKIVYIFVIRLCLRNSNMDNYIVTTDLNAFFFSCPCLKNKFDRVIYHISRTTSVGPI